MKTALAFAVVILVVASGTEGKCGKYKHQIHVCNGELDKCRNQVTAIQRDSEQKQAQCTKGIADEKKRNDDCKRDADARVASVNKELSDVKNELDKARGRQHEKEKELIECSQKIVEEKRHTDDCKRDIDARVASVNKELSKTKEDLDKARKTQYEKEMELIECSKEIAVEKRRIDDCKDNADERIASANKELNQIKGDLEKTKESYRDKKKELDECLKKKEICQKEKGDNALSNSEIVAQFQNVFNIRSNDLKGIIEEVSERLHSSLQRAQRAESELEDCKNTRFRYIAILICLGGVVIGILFTLLFCGRSSKSELAPHSSEKKHATKKID